MILYKKMKPIEHVLFHWICVLSHLMCACKYCIIKLSFYYWTHWSCWWIYHFKKYRFNPISRFFKNAIFQNRHIGRLKKQIRVEETLSGSSGHMRQNAYYQCCRSVVTEKY